MIALGTMFWLTIVGCCSKGMMGYLFVVAIMSSGRKNGQKEDMFAF
jgi:hypothetical protein